ncbi:zinc carboxypeptidase [Microtetraspora sp. NBRC 13810]|uniref:M14 family zinc carboxypeptidase n=1 Tax=Microtetraspora sp. NBRC 13810 TaxID=3030990 RepID=UPI0024A50BCA|nr:M14 family zinc carboxypeptidase [Microtetraspora sp. NBRC 13810]GLW10883.1 zinc carboxypeptidase [Microtetraspora sp. NBRC 13810]
MLESWLAGELDTVPGYTRFSTVDEVTAGLTRLAADRQDVAALRRVGTSRLGEPMWCLTVGDGPRHALVAAMPHPNEPIGGLTVVHLAARLCADPGLRARTGYTWHIVACLDPDGTRLNEGWFAGPFTKSHYGRHFYRPAGHEQVEWTFPFAYKGAYFDRVLPETLALMRLIDDTRPAFMTTLHNAELGGAFFYLNRPEPALHGVLKDLARRYGVPLHAGEPEHPSMRRFEESVFQLPDMRDSYDYAEKMGQDPAAAVGGGGGSDSYAARYGTLSIAAELPYWRDPSAADLSATGDVYRDLLLAQAADMRATSAVLGRVMEEVRGDVVSDSPFLRASRFFVPLIDATAVTNELRAAQPAAERPATVAERQSGREIVHSFRLRFGGMLLRALEGELAIGNGTPAIRGHAASLAGTYAAWCAEAESGTPAETIPIGHLVAIQYGSLLAGAAQAAS